MRKWFCMVRGNSMNWQIDKMTNALANQLIQNARLPVGISNRHLNFALWWRNQTIDRGKETRRLFQKNFIMNDGKILYCFLLSGLFSPKMEIESVQCESSTNFAVPFLSHTLSIMRCCQCCLLRVYSFASDRCMFWQFIHLLFQFLPYSLCATLNGTAVHVFGKIKQFSYWISFVQRLNCFSIVSVDSLVIECR